MNEIVFLICAMAIIGLVAIRPFTMPRLNKLQKFFEKASRDSVLYTICILTIAILFLGQPMKFILLLMTAAVSPILFRKKRKKRKKWSFSQEAPWMVLVAVTIYCVVW